MTDRLTGRRIALPETRQLDVLAGMLERQGAEVLRCPLVGIVDAPDSAPVEAWIAQVGEGACDDLLFYTGEGLRRLVALAERTGRRDAFLAALAAARKITRGPKPARALREIGLKPDLMPETPTTEGLIALLEGERLAGRRIGVQLYPGDGAAAIVDFLQRAGASLLTVTPYAYVAAAEDARVIALIDALAAGTLDAIAFTSGPQVRRLHEVAEASGRADALSRGLARTAIAAVGPVVAREIEKTGGRVAIAPEGLFSMKPFVGAIAAALGPQA